VRQSIPRGPGPAAFVNKILARGWEPPGTAVVAGDSLQERAAIVARTYSSYGRGLDILIGAYNWLDLTPKGRDEEGLAHGMAWVRHHDKYGEEYQVDAKAEYVQHAKASASPGDCCEHHHS